MARGLNILNSLTVKEVVKELDISRSYLYKLIERENLILPKTKTGRYYWDNNSVLKLKSVLDNKVYSEISDNEIMMKQLNLSESFINNRRFLGNKHSLTEFIRNTVEENCQGINIIADVFSGTGAVSNAFKDKMIITNDLLYSNYISNYAWFASEKYSSKKIINIIYKYNSIQTSENNYMRKNFADTFFSADDCSKIGYIREDIELKYKAKEINYKEYAILITSLLYGMDKIANTVGHYDAYRKNGDFNKKLVLNVILPDENLNANNKCYNEDATKLVKKIECDLLYLDPPYNSRQYSDAYHLLENVARWEKPKVYGVAKKMDRSHIKSEYCKTTASKAFEELVENTNVKYILLSYNNMSNKGNDRSNAKISDEDILRILKKKGKVTIFEEEHKAFSTGKSNIKENKERLFLCEIFSKKEKKLKIACPFNYIGGKYKLLEQLESYFLEPKVFFDVFAGGGNVGINSSASKVIFNDNNEKLIGLIEYIKNTETEELLSKIKSVISRYNLSDTSLYGYEYYDCNSSKGLSKYNKEKFLRLREDYNKKLREGVCDYALLYVLIVFSFNNQMRFNRKGEFNLPVGKRDFNSRMKSKLILFSEELKKKDVSFLNLDFRNISLDDVDKDTFIYCDPPYLITGATYNENGMWTESDEKDLLKFLDEIDKKGLKFALSNVLISKNKENTTLKEWIEDRNYHCHYLDKSYSNSNYQRKNKHSISQEVLVTNYKILEDSNVK